MVALLDVAILRVDLLPLMAITVVLNLAAAIVVNYSQYRSKGYASSTPMSQWVNKNTKYLWTWIVFCFLIFTLLQFALVICMQKILVAAGAEFLPWDEFLFQLSRRQVLIFGFNALGSHYLIFAVIERLTPDWEVDILGTSERRLSSVFTDTSRPFEVENQKYKTSESSGYQPPAATLRASKVPRKRIVSSITQQPL